MAHIADINPLVEAGMAWALGQLESSYADGASRPELGLLAALLHDLFESLAKFGDQFIPVLSGEVDFEGALIDFEYDLQHLVWHFEFVVRELAEYGLYSGELPDWRAPIVPLSVQRNRP